MNNSEVARVFADIAVLLELKNENPFKIRAYRKAAESIETLPTELADVATQDLQKIPGVGEAIARKITDLLTTGRLVFYENLKAEFPDDIIVLLHTKSPDEVKIRLREREGQGGS